MLATGRALSFVDGLLDALRLACLGQLRASLGLLRLMLLWHLSKVLVGTSVSSFFAQDECEERPP